MSAPRNDEARWQAGNVAQQTALCSQYTAEINHEHALALQHADTAIEHAKRAGELLVKVKDSLPHGEFLPWLDANVTVSPRQAQRYMRAAQGKPLPIRAIKNDTVSHLPITERGEYLHAVIVRGNWRDEFFLMPVGDGEFAHYATMSGPNSGDAGCHATYSKRPVRFDRALEFALHGETFPFDQAEIHRAHDQSFPPENIFAVSAT